MSLKMNADVVALTACQTGLGKELSGEGVMSMGRAFQCAGAKSVLMSLWSVAEDSSVVLTESFFRNVKAGKSKLEALRLAPCGDPQGGIRASVLLDAVHIDRRDGPTLTDPHFVRPAKWRPNFKTKSRGTADSDLWRMLR